MTEKLIDFNIAVLAEENFREVLNNKDDKNKST